jgi:single-stranded DNA-binding protein
VIQKYVKKGNPLHVVGHIAYRTWTDNDKVKHHHTAIVIDSFTLLGRLTCQANESAPDPDDGAGTVAVDADQSSELHDDSPF